MSDPCSDGCQSAKVANAPTSGIANTDTAFQHGYVSDYRVPKMDCPSEEGMIRMALDSIRKLPRQEDNSKVETPALCCRTSAGVRSPNESWGRSSLYSSIHQNVASRTSSSEVNRCWSRMSSR